MTLHQSILKSGGESILATFTKALGINITVTALNQHNGDNNCQISGGLYGNKMSQSNTTAMYNNAEGVDTHAGENL